MLLLYNLYFTITMNTRTSSQEYSLNISQVYNRKKFHSDNHSAQVLDFKSITSENMPEIMKFLDMEPNRTTDYSYGGVYMWKDYFDYQYAIYNDTLFIKGVLENHRDIPAYSLPLGKMSMKEAIELLKKQSHAEGLPLVLSAIPEEQLSALSELNPTRIEELPDWADYLYDATQLASLSGKKMSKKRNHVNKFHSLYDGRWKLLDLTAENAHLAMEFMNVFDLEGDNNELAVAEREMTRNMIAHFEEHPERMVGALLLVDDKVCAFTIGDVKGDTLYVHIEKATRTIEGSYEMINKSFAEAICSRYTQVAYINREDDAGDPGLRLAKESYKPLAKLKKYNIGF